MSTTLHMAVFGLYAADDGLPMLMVLQRDRPWDSYEDVKRFAESQAHQGLYEGHYYAAIIATSGSEMVVWRTAELLL